MNSEPNLSHLVAHCVTNRRSIEITGNGDVFIGAKRVAISQLAQELGYTPGAMRAARAAMDDAAAPAMPAPFRVAGYEDLAAVLLRAFEQAAKGKGKERHAGAGEAFTEQVMQDMARRFGVGALLGQAFKKSEESQRLPHDRAVAELLGAIVYLAGAVIAMERRQRPANDNAPQATNDNARATCPCGIKPATSCSGCNDA